jgi:BirA family biotin operon repressor/biotin-[acetyl-CoA-carboxylase] ligase
MSFGWPHRHYARTDSTNTRARELAASGAPHGTVITAAEQTEGRGRQGRTWSAPAGRALLYSAVVRPLDERHLLLPLAVPLAVCEAAEKLQPGIECKVKWPNDVEVGGRKLAGVLIEARPQDGWGVIGVGLNLSIEPDQFPPELRDRAVSLLTAASPARSVVPSARHSGLRNRATEALSERLADWLAAGPDTVLTAWRRRDALRGRRVSWEGGSGVADGIDDRGYLVVIAPGGRISIGAGEVHLSRS